MKRITSTKSQWRQLISKWWKIQLIFRQFQLHQVILPVTKMNQAKRTRSFRPTNWRKTRSTASSSSWLRSSRSTSSMCSKLWRKARREWKTCTFLSSLRRSNTGNGCLFKITSRQKMMRRTSAFSMLYSRRKREERSRSICSNPCLSSIVGMVIKVQASNSRKMIKKRW